VWGDRVRIHVSSEHGRAPLASLIASEKDGAHFYCCGPESMLDDFARATASLPPERVHVERFEAAKPPADAGSFQVRLARCGKEISALLQIHEQLRFVLFKCQGSFKLLRADRVLVCLIADKRRNATCHQSQYCNGI